MLPIELNRLIKDLQPYSPITLKGNLIKDGFKRKFKNQSVRIQNISNHILNRSSLLDLGCHTGFMLRELIRINNINATGVDRTEDMINVCRYIDYMEKNQSEFIIYDINDFVDECIKRQRKYDNVMMLSVWDFEMIVSSIDRFLAITNNKLFLEPTNHERYSIEELVEKYKNVIKKKYNSEILTTTDYQNRLLIMVNKC